MMKHFSKFAAVAALSLVVGAANAATQTFNSSFTKITNFTNFAATPAITNFDTSLGTLLTIKITMGGSLTTNVTSQLAALVGATPPVNVDAQTTGSLQFNNPAAAPNTRILKENLDSGVTTVTINNIGDTTNFGGPLVSDPANTTFLGTGLVDNGDGTYSKSLSSGSTGNDLLLWNLLGSGGPGATTSFLVTGSSVTGVNNTSGGTATFINTIATTATGNIKVVYTYDAAPPPPPVAPEPASLALLAMGGLGLVARRRK